MPTATEPGSDGQLNGHRAAADQRPLGRVSNVGGVAGLIICECMIGMC